MSDLLTPAEAAEYLRVSVRTLRTLRARHGLPTVRLGRKVLYRLPDLERYVARQTVVAPATSHVRPMVETQSRVAKGSGSSRRAASDLHERYRRAVHGEGA